MKMADTALYYAKENGKNQYSIYTKEMEVDKLNYINTVNEIKEAIEQLEILKEFSCDDGQGYYFNPPMPANELIHAIKE